MSEIPNRGHLESEGLARLLIELEQGEDSETAGKLHAAFRICQKLRPHLITLAGVEGFRSLLSRAVTLARSEAPLLAALRVNSDGTFDFLDEAQPLFEGEEATHAGVLLVAELLDLLSSFVGKPLTLRLLGRAWPRLDYRQDNEETHE